MWRSSPASALLESLGTGALPLAVEALVGQMTLEEKAGQLTLMAAAWAGGAASKLNPIAPTGGYESQLADAAAGRLTGVFNGNGAKMALAMQQAAMRGRLKIPLIFAADVIHGFRTVFPVPLGEAASFDPALAERTARVAALEAAAAGIDWTFAPMVDIARDARWGRGVEGAGEDVLLGCDFARARVRGFQGSTLTANDAVMACAKHFAAYGAGEGGLDYNSVDISERSLRDVYFPPFAAALDAGAGSVMAAFNEVAGIPATASHWLMTDVLRNEWGFGGLTVSDYTGDEELIAHGFAADERDAARLAFLAGVDMSMQSALYIKYLPDLVRSGAVPMARLDQAVRRVFRVKVALGLFADPFRRIDAKREAARIGTPANRAVARDAARRSIVLLKNDGALLPLAQNRKIALVGPFAAGQHDLIGPWNVYGSDADAIDLATGVRAQAGPRAEISVTPGSGVDVPLDGGIAAAVAAAQAADVVVLAIGESQDMSGEAQARTEIVVPAAQRVLAEALAATGKPIVVLLKNGRALALDGAVLAAPAILVTWFLGSEGGPAIADILFGRFSPSGRLPVSFPRATGQAPYYYAHKATGRPNPDGPLEPFKAHYRGIPNTALFPFGHGLTYGQVAYTGLETSNGGTVSADGTLSVSATVSNTGKVVADEVVQLYVHDVAASITRPVRQLVAYRRITLAPGASQKVSFTLRRSDLTFIGTAMKPTVEPGAFQVWIAPSAEAEGVSGRFTLAA
ncbi:glycoside hydrolase family 3 N-terminal domain-containing protein [Sphingomonas sp. 10B4]|uniref:glycoside hydrolase family 3 N-terminal domain-containing protein n=1 Tax=Sphingomonas sp. 10B4 TaxID=3048575 RepID=UPI002AB41D39|nr:glycoside hydrolase family 3 N-terminal domain-containing protein [Sphingomonas sp. 10B4]MDY7525294.1 glycoside hydrolase family 3 N-terminal domain-containing protein [Sphingomonas sp. 10B4]MEB0282758.1 glycoside hydrolase family 3 N-terminal domain-containing protein [Sphingomonas sp. 10B4]